MAEGSNGRRRFSDKWGKHELDVLAVLFLSFFRNGSLPVRSLSA